jgi:hypothetical protein
MLFWCSGCGSNGTIPSMTPHNLKYSPKLNCGACK